ncbi:MAG: lamin tail domain-containing protein, partial [Candidatus Poseidoniaceae archaeon]|nr:lamin tail domain-containing protein [Candidatus Poseidoniaceae archaeon]
MTDDGLGAWASSFFPTPGVVNANWLPTVINSTSFLQLNEVLPNSSIDGNPYPDGEWIEIYNSGPTTIDLAGWRVKDSLGIVTWLDSNSLVSNTTQMGTTIAAGGYRLIQTDSNNLLWEDWDTLSLYDPQGDIVDALHWVNDFGTDISLIGQENVSSPWLNSPYNTPGQPNPSSGSATDADIFISEVMSDPAGTDTESYPDGEWIELVNFGNDSADLAGWNFVAGGSRNFNIDAESIIGKNNTTIESGEYVVVAVNSSSFYLRNSNGDSLELRDGSDNVIHSIIWSIEVTEGESLFAPPSNASSNWIQTPWPTPGAANPIFGTYFGSTTVEMTE